MAKSKAKTLSAMNSINELIDFFETHDLGEYWEQMPEADFEVNLKRRKHLVALEEDVAARVTAIAKAKKVSSEALINKWLKERLREAS